MGRRLDADLDILVDVHESGSDRLSFTAPGEEALRAAGVPAQDVERFIVHKLP
jgi:hypothetical protein